MEKNIDKQDVAVVVLTAELKRLKLLLQEWRNKEILPDLYRNLCDRTDKALQS